LINWCREKGVEVIHIRAVYTNSGSLWIPFYNDLRTGFQNIDQIRNVEEDFAQALPGVSTKFTLGTKGEWVDVRNTLTKTRSGSE
jgi:hypothetical protein